MFLDKCPVCRAPFEEYVTITNSVSQQSQASSSLSADSTSSSSSSRNVICSEVVNV